MWILKFTTIIINHYLSFFEKLKTKELIYLKYENLMLEKKGHIAIIKMNRPHVLNALNIETLNELDRVVTQLSHDKDVFVIILTGEGKAFVAGADVAEMSAFTVFESRRFSHLGHRIFRKLDTLEIPTIAAVNGFALGGGCELAMACDIRIASENAKFGQPEVKLGITPGFGGTQRLARLIGSSMAKQLIFTGDIIDAEEALRINLVNKVVPAETLLDEAFFMAERIASNGPIAVQLSKTAINRGLDMNLDTALSYEAEIFSKCFSTKDQKTGMKAFLEKTERFFENK